MKFKKYIVVVPVVELNLDLLTFGEGEYTWVPFWDDLRSLHGKCIFHEFKIFVDQPNPASFPPKLFVCTLVNAQSEKEAYEKGTESVLFLSNSLVRLFLRGFEPKYHETIATPFYPTKLPATTEDTISVELVKLTTKNGNIKGIATPYMVYEPRVALHGSAAHEKYVTTHFKIPKLEAGTSNMPTIHMLQKEVLLNIGPHLKNIRASKSSDETKLMNVVATLYSAAVTTENISVSYLLLWQILESFASSKGSGEKLLTGNARNKIEELLQHEGYDVVTAQRVSSVLGMLRGKNDIQIIAEMLKEYLFPNEEVDVLVLRQDVEKFRKIRHAIVHPKGSERLDANELQANYKKLRDIVYKLLLEIRTF